MRYIALAQRLIYASTAVVNFFCLFTAMHALHATRSSQEKDVCCLSVRPSVKRMICDKTKETCADILIPCERHYLP